MKVIWLPTKHLGVPKNSFKHVCTFQIKLDFEVFIFGESEKMEYLEKMSQSKGENQHKLTYGHTVGFEPGPHW